MARAPLPRILCLTSLYAGLSAAPSQAAFVRDTVLSTTTMTSGPQLVLAPGTGEPHIAFRFGSGVRYAHLVSGSWTFETITDSASALSWAIGPTGRLAAVYSRPNGALLCSRRELMGWVADTIQVVPGRQYTVAAAVDGGTDEPRVAFVETEPGSPQATQRLRYARRSTGAWTIEDIYSYLGGSQTPSLALTQSGQPRIGFITPDSLYLFQLYGRDSDSDPFTSQGIDTLVPLWHSLALDPQTDEPRIATLTQNDDGYFPIQYHWRENSVWQKTEVTLLYILPDPLSLALDGAGNPGIAFFRSQNILALADPAPGATPAGGFYSTDFLYAHRMGGTGFDPFTIENVAGPTPNSDPTSLTLRSLARLPDGSPRFAWVEIAQGNPPLPRWVIYGRPSPPLAAQSAIPARFQLEAVAPNPGSQGEVWVRFGLAAADEVSLQLLDVSGRRVASRPAQSLDAGWQTLRWTPGPLPAGLYWIVLRTRTRRAASAKWMVLQ